MSGEWHRKHLGADVPEQAAGEETLLGAAGDEVPPGGVVAGSFNQEFPGADPYAGIPADEVGLPSTAAETTHRKRATSATTSGPTARLSCRSGLVSCSPATARAFWLTRSAAGK